MELSYDLTNKYEGGEGGPPRFCVKLVSDIISHLGFLIWTNGVKYIV